MLKSSMIIPENLIVGFQNRFPNTKYEDGRYYVDINGEKAYINDNYSHRSFIDEEKYKEHYIKYSFITFKDKSKIRKEHSWEQWRDKKIDILEIPNIPTLGFILEETTQRSRDWFGSGRNVWVVKHPLGFMFEITSNNLEGIIANCNIEKGEIIGECIFAWKGAAMSLIPISSIEYQNAIENTKIKKLGKSINIRNLVPGNKILLHNNQEVLFLGKFKYSLETRSEDYNYFRQYGHYNQRFEIVEFQNNKYIFYNEKNNEILGISSPKISKITSLDNISEEEIYKILFNIPIYNFKINARYSYMVFKEKPNMENILSIKEEIIESESEIKGKYNSYIYDSFKYENNKFYFKIKNSLSYQKIFPCKYNAVYLNYLNFNKSIL